MDSRATINDDVVRSCGSGDDGIDTVPRLLGEVSCHPPPSNISIIPTNNTTPKRFLRLEKKCPTTNSLTQQSSPVHPKIRASLLSTRMKVHQDPLMRRLLVCPPVTLVDKELLTAYNIR